MAESGCLLLLLLGLAGTIWLVVHLVTRSSRQGQPLEARLLRLESQVAALQAELRSLREPGDGIPADTVDPETMAPAPSLRDGRSPQGETVAATRAGEDAATSGWVVSDPLDDGGPGESDGASGDAPPPVEATPPAAEPPADGSGSGLQEPPPERPSAPPPPPRPPIDWEQWLGVRGVAVLGGIVLAIAGIYLVRYSIEQNLVPPVVRVALLFVAGIVAIGFGERLRPRGHVFPANALQGAGVVMLYSASWAARNLYDLISSGVAFGLLALVTVAGGVLAVRHGSLVIAVLGLLGGFATPLLVSSGSDNVVGLFGYLLLLNAGIAFVGRGRWPILSALSLVGTLLYQVAWIFGAMEDRILVGLVVLGVFAAFFLLLGERRRGGREERADRPLEIGVTLGALFSPFAFGLYFAAQSDRTDQLAPLGVLLLLLNAAAAWIGHRRREVALPAGAVAASLGVLVVWPFPRELSVVSLRESLAGLVALGVLHQLAVEWLHRREPSPRQRWSLPPVVASGVGLVTVSLFHAAHWPQGASGWFLLGGLVLASLLLREAARLDEAGLRSLGAHPGTPAPRARSWIPALLVSVGLSLFFLLSFLVRSVEPEDAGPYAAPRLLVVLVLLAVTLQLAPLRRLQRLDILNRAHGFWGQPSFERALAMLPLLGILSLMAARTPSDGPPGVLTGVVMLMLASLVLLAATRLGEGGLVGAAVAATVLSQSVLVDQTASTVAMLVLVTVTAAVLALWPSVFAPRVELGARDERWPLSAWRAAALAPLVFAPAVHHLFEQAITRRASALPLLALAALAVLGLRRASERVTADQRASVQAWFGGVALALLALAVPLQLDREWITVGWALLAYGLVLLWQRVDHAGLKLFALGLALAVAARLVANPEVLRYHEPRAPLGLPVLGWLLYTYLLPAILLLLAARSLEHREAERLRSWEPFQHLRRPWVAPILAFLGIVVTFAWVNLTIFDAFADGTRLTIALDRQPARDLALSVAWGLFALGLLAAGVARRSKPLRWTSLVVLFATIAKVFLYDLGELEDLWRVGSLVGLALSLLAVSILYQRFVFGGQHEQDARATAAAPGDEDPQR